MDWSVRLHDDFDPEFAELTEPVQDELLALMALLKECGPKLGRPHADTLDDSKHANMKELRFKSAGGVWRVTYAFDPKREGILLAAGNKSGVSESRFYKQLILKSDARFDNHLKKLKGK
ncbi:MAG: type II toxin-antitoxin system RelE/ParE family toxin [Steroidobacteraceae bacterium]